MAFAELRPSERGFRLDVEIDFPTPVIGRQRRAVDLSPAVFRREIARARTFGFMGDVEKLWKAGFALGASLDNTVAIGDDGIINPEGLRFADEFVRHKMLDAVGDLSLGGLPILGHLSLLLRRPPPQFRRPGSAVRGPVELRDRGRQRPARAGYAEIAPGMAVRPSPGRALTPTCTDLARAVGTSCSRGQARST